MSPPAELNRRDCGPFDASLGFVDSLCQRLTPLTIFLNLSENRIIVTDDKPMNNPPLSSALLSYKMVEATESEVSV